MNTVTASIATPCMLTGTNFSEWKEQIELSLGYGEIREIDVALRVDEPGAITDESTDDEIAHYEAWKMSNRLSLKFFRIYIPTNIKTSLPKTENAKEYLANEGKHFKIADKSLAEKLMVELTTMCFDGTRTMHEHVIEMSNLASKLKALGMIVDESFLIQFILNSLPPQYGPFQIYYNTIKDKWDITELANMLVQEERRLKQQSTQVAHLTTQRTRKKFGKMSEKGNKRVPPKLNNNDQPAKKKGRNDTCKKSGHFQKDFIKRQKWFEKKGIPYDPNHKSK